MKAQAAKFIREDDVKAIARELAPEPCRTGFQTGQDRKVPAAAIQLLNDSGLLDVMRARRRGGSELSMTAHVDAVSTIAEGCGGRAWALGDSHTAATGRPRTQVSGFIHALFEVAAG